MDKVITKETIEEVNVEWDTESYPFPVMIVSAAKEQGNAWMTTTHWTHSEYKIDKSENLLYNINNERKE